MYRLIRVSEPTTEPVSLDEACQHLRIDPDSTESALVESLISAARDWCERYCNRAWASAQFIEVFDRFPAGAIELTDPGATAIDSIEYLDTDGQPVTISGSSTVFDPHVGTIDYDWPEGSRIKVTYTAGGTVPPAVVFAIKLALTDFYENRNAQQWQALYSNPAAERLMHSYRVGLGV